MKRVIRETWRLNRDRFPTTGILVISLRRTDCDDMLPDELLGIARKIVDRTAKPASEVSPD